ncbi:MAG: hypothetical protein WCR67_00735 [Bacilli bacterium]
MDKTEIIKRIKERQKRIFTKDMFMNLLLLLPPILLEGLLLLTAFLTYGLSLALTYFVLPMFYTVERRIRSTISGIGTAKVTYVDGYKAFFTSAQGGIFGVIGSFLFGFMLLLFGYLILSFTIPYLCNMFNGAAEALNTITEAYNTASTDVNAFIQSVSENIVFLVRPLTVFVGLIFFLPSAFVIFYDINGHLTDHYLCTIVLPDIDLNISASQARAISKGSFRRIIMGEKLSYSFQNNWMYYLIYTVLYGVTLFLFSMVSTSSMPVVSLVMIATPAISLLYGIILDYFCLANEYCIIEEISPLLLSRMPIPMKVSINQTFTNPNYNHGQESAIRGAFVPNQTFREAHPFSSPFASDNNNNSWNNGFVYSKPSDSTYTEKPSSSEPSSEKKEETAPVGGVIDLTSDSDKDSKDNGKENN